MSRRQAFLIPLFILSILALTGCAAMHTSMAKRDLDVQTRMSKTIFLDPVPEAKKTVYLQIRNTSAKHDLDIEPNLHWSLSQRGYTLVRSPEQAHYMMQVNVLRIGKINVREMNSDMDAGFGGAIVGAALAGATGADTGAIVGAGIAGAAIGVAIDALTKDVYYTLVTDVQLSERTGAHWKRHQTRVVSTANKVNLKFQEAVPELAYGVTHAIAGIM